MIVNDNPKGWRGHRERQAWAEGWVVGLLVGLILVAAVVSVWGENLIREVCG